MHKLPFVVAAIILVWIASPTVFAQAKEAPTEQLIFSLKPIKDKVLPLEPIYLKFTLENRSNKPVTLARSIDLHSLRIAVMNESGSIDVANQLKGLSGPRFRQPIAVAPGNHTWNALWEWNLVKYLGSPGKYRIQAIFENGDDILATNWAKLVIENPSGEESLAFVQILERTKNPFPDGGVFTLALQTNRVAFIEKFPDSVYSDYVRYFAAQSYEDDNRRKAIEYYETIASKPDFVLAGEAKKRLLELGGRMPTN